MGYVLRVFKVWENSTIDIRCLKNRSAGEKQEAVQKRIVDSHSKKRS